MNKIDLPEAGKGVSLAFNLAAMEALSEKFGESYVADTLRRLDLRDPETLKICVQHMASKEVNLSALMQKMAIDDLVMKIADAINVALTGKRIGAE
jgi:hypothetical protein